MRLRNGNFDAGYVVEGALIGCVVGEGCLGVFMKRQKARVD